jgi:hypothetical protein
MVYLGRMQNEKVGFSSDDTEIQRYTQKMHPVQFSEIVQKNAFESSIC